MSIRIITDSTADVAENYKKQLIRIPLTVAFGEEEFIDEITIDRNTFYAKLEDSAVLPKTSQPSPDRFGSVFKELADKGDEGIVLTVASRLSGTYQSACIAAEEYPNIRVIDSKNAALGTGILAEYALSCIDKGYSLDDLTDHLKEKVSDICLLARLDTLKYLEMGGRISKTAALAGGLLDIKPVITITEGEVIVIGKARGSRKANNLLIEMVTNKGVDFSMPILLGYTGASDELLTQYIEASQPLWEGNVESLDKTQVCSVIGTHAGPGAVAVAFFVSKETQKNE